MGEYVKARFYEELEIWKLGMDLAEQVYGLTASWPEGEKYGLVSQARRAAVSIPSNIAEGWGRGPGRAFRNHLLIARGSLFELRTLLKLAGQLGYGHEGNHQPALSFVDRINAMLNSYVSAMEREVREESLAYGDSADSDALPQPPYDLATQFPIDPIPY